MKKINDFFGYALFTVGTLRMLLIILVLIKMISNLAIIFNGGYADLNYYNLFSTVLAYSQLILAIGSVVMMIINVKKQPGVIRGYLWGLGAVLIELIAPRILIFYVSVAECGMYMKAGITIRKKNNEYPDKHKTTKREIKNTKWFYENSEDKNNNEKVVDKNKFNIILNETNKQILEENKNLIIGLIVGAAIVLILIICISSSDKNKKDILEIKEVTNIENNNVNNEKLENISNICNNSRFIKELRESGYEINVLTEKNEIIIYVLIADTTCNVRYTLENSILSTEIYKSQIHSGIDEINQIIAIALIDSVGKSKGYEEGELFDELMSKGLTYTLEKDGVEIKLSEDKQKLYIRTDLNSSYSFLKK